ncbi:MAG: hydrogenase formation protein HypD [Candidatus Omnitrophica bacterium]|nr:hydrogenase formation protein HypD [Candidatus Omnitrophota bacterium]MDD5487717.1 hydrogenase formation protein HypD [Candidatus Omnitrophota bacterium]
MKYVDEFRDRVSVETLATAIRGITTREWTIMEVCGGQTHSIMRFGIDELIPRGITLVHGPGCPVCVTPVEAIDRAIRMASMKDVVLCSFGDMLRVPGSSKDLLGVKAEGGDVRVVYSPMDALKMAVDDPGKKVVFFAVGFETTAPGNAMAVYQAKKNGVDNFYMLVSHVLVPPAMRLILSDSNNRVQGFLAAGHVCAVMGYDEYEGIAKDHWVPIVVTGFEPVDIMKGIYMCVKQLEEGRFDVENQYSRVVKREGNPEAKRIMKEVFDLSDRKWRGIGNIPLSGLVLNGRYEGYDAEKVFGLDAVTAEEDQGCMSGKVLRGIIRPDECGKFGGACTPEHPLGAPMVSSEGACAAYYNYKDREKNEG